MLPGMIGRHSDRRGALQSLASVGLGDRVNHLPPELSGGEQQRVAIARALTNDPDIIFADEPTGNLDSKTGDAIMDLLLGLAQERKKTLVVVTHDNNLAQRGDRTLRIVDEFGCSPNGVPRCAGSVLRFAEFATPHCMPVSQFH